jgi:hypothetical protein
MPVPMASEKSWRIWTIVAGGAGSWARVWKARVWRASPARMAMARLAEDDVAGGLAAAEVVVVERGQVVVDERVGVHHLERGGEVGCARGKFTGDHTCGFHAEHGAQALSTSEGAVAHSPVDGVGWGGRGGQQALQRFVGEGRAGFQERLDVSVHGSNTILVLRSYADGESWVCVER